MSSHCSLALKDDEGKLIMDLARIESIFFYHFCKLFKCRVGDDVMGREESVSLSEEVSNLGFCPDILPSVKSRLSKEQRLALDRPFSAEDVKEALFQMDGCKAPGPDGFIAAFYQ